MGFIVLQDCLEDAAYALAMGNAAAAVANLKTARQNLKSLTLELMQAKGKIEELEQQLIQHHHPPLGEDAVADS